MSLLSSVVREHTNKLFAADIRNFLSSGIDFNFLKEYGISIVNYDEIQEQLLRVMDEIMDCTQARRILSGSYTAALYDVFSRYLRVAFVRNRYIHFEITKVQKLQLTPDHLSSMMKVILLLLPVTQMLLERKFPDSSAPIVPIPTSILDDALDYLIQRVTLLPESIIRSAVYAQVSFAENNQIDATSRIAAVFSARCKNYHSAITAQRGAESADKSWFYLAKRNYKFYGFDDKMIEEFYSIASEEKW